MIYEKLMEISKHYIYRELLKEEVIAFRDQFEIIFSNFSKELEKEVSTEEYELLDSIYLAFDSYEPNELIRTNEKYCIDEKELINKIKYIMEKIEMN